MALSPGDRLGPYEILAPLGAGGMGEVYRARDTRLERLVAIKVLPEHLARDPRLRQRLEREARAISSLSHPNVCALYDVGSRDDRYFLVMEHLDGADLGSKLAGGALPVEAALRIAVQIARGLDAAHGKEVLHRDLKPSNVHVDAAGNVKLLDFGLAKTPAGEQTGDASSLPTQGLDATREGTLLGSPPYMSPERVRAKPADRAADVWSFGCVLYEMLAGAPPFRGETVSDVLAAVLHHEPDWKRLPPALPAGIRRLLERCLEKDAGRRLGDAHECAVEIDRALAEIGPPARARHWPRAAAWIGGALVVGLVAAVALLGRRTLPTPAAPTPVLSQVTFARGVEEFPALSPDGERLAYATEVDGIRRLFLLGLGPGASPAPVTGGGYDEIQPAWSPDGESLLFVRAQQPGTKLEPGDVYGWYEGGDVWRLELASGRESRLLENAFSPVYSPNGKHIAVDASWVGSRGIWLVDDAGRNPVQLTAGDSEAASHFRPRWSPDGRWIVFQQVVRTDFDLRVVEVETGRQVVLTDDEFVNIQPVWSSSGRTIYFSSYRSGGMNVWRVPVAADGSAAGRPQQITRGAGIDVELAVSPGSDRIAFAILKQNADLYRMPLSPSDGRPTGPPEEVVETTREDSRGAWSPDGGRIAFNSDRTGDMNVWVHDLADGSSRQVTTGPGGDFQPQWSPDGTHLAFFSSRAANADIWDVELASGALRQLTDGPATEVNPFFSPDGSLIAYQSDEGGRMEVWVMGADGADRRQLTRVGVRGHFLRWSADGSHVYFRCLCGGDSRTMRVPRAGGEPEPTAEVAGGAHMSFSPDHKRILDVTGHKVLWVSPLDGGAPQKVFESDDPGVRIDYPVWSPDGRWVLFDRFRPQGGDIWLMTGVE